ncbi:MAG: GT4 family glycosyltransferase PelF [Leptothrix sp. (in: b-proteobacteria)]
MSPPRPPAPIPPGERRAAEADIAFLLEGTFPYVSGGVSSWVNTLLRGFPELRFAIYFLGSRPDDYGPMRYELPANVVHFETHYLFDTEGRPPQRDAHTDAAAFDKVRELHEHWRSPQRGAAMPDVDALFGAVIDEMDDRLDESHFLRGDRAWGYINEQYTAQCADPSFVDYFWTVRMMHAPLWRLQRLAAGMIPVRAFHTVSTGYAGLLGAMCQRRWRRPLVLSEHGIYTKERKIDLFSARWIADNRTALQRDATQLSYFRDMWIRFFEGIGRACYDASNPIIALYESNRQRQVLDGAAAERTTCIANGISIPTFAPLRALRPAAVPQVLCLIGRVVPIKDVKTFVRAMRTVVNRLPEAQGWIAGPTDEDPDYGRECEALVAGLGLQAHVKFLGFQRLTELLPKVGLVVLSSISEALPLVLLEGFAAGVPAVSTDVGSCRQLIEGLPGDDAALGRAGRVVSLADPRALADAAVELLADPQAWAAAAASGIARVERYYALDTMLDRYREVYDGALAQTAAASGGESPGGSVSVPSGEPTWPA